MKSIFGLLSFWGMICLLPSSFAQTNPNQPNILLVIADDLGVDALNGYQQNPLVPTTPTLDSLRQSGLTFTQAWANPVCSPSRAAFLSGKYGVKTGVVGVPGNLDTTHRSIFKELDAQTNGQYAHAWIGKWHMSSPAENDHPQWHGVDHFVGLMGGTPGDYYNWSKVTNGVSSTETEYATTHLTTQALSWINAQNTPWFAVLAHPAPHSPFHVPPAGTYTQNPVNNNSQQYMAAIEAIDFELARLLANIPAAVRANTVIMFMGDNGSPGSVAQNYPNGHAKGSLYQGGVQVPLIISGAGVSRVQEKEAGLVHIADLHATILEIAGASLAGGLFNSWSFKDLLQNANAQRKPYNYSEVNHNTVGWTIRNNQYKLIEFGNGTQEFYDLLADSLELTDLMGNLTAAQLAVKTDLETEASEIQHAWSCRDLIQNGSEPAVDSCTTTSCPNDNSLSTTNIGCCDSPSIASVYVETVSGGRRMIQSNNFPIHRYCYNPNRQPVPRNYSFEMPAVPMLASSPTSVIRENGRPVRYYGVSINGVVMAPAPATPFIFENPNTGEYNWDWVFEPTNTQGPNNGQVQLDCASAHTGPQGYHYHGNMFEYVEQLQPGISTLQNPPASVMQIGWASDGFPILYRFGPDATGQLKLLQPSYRLKAGERPGDGITAPCGPYNGRYTNDYAYVQGAGDLDECNGIAQSISLLTASGTETFGYFYVITDSFPQIARCLKGTPDPSFESSNQGTTSAEALAASIDWSVKPNPVKGDLYISATGLKNNPTTLELYTLEGKLVKRQSFQQGSAELNASFSTSSLPQGLYLLRAFHGASVYTFKVNKIED